MVASRTSRLAPRPQQNPDLPFRRKKSKHNIPQITDILPWNAQGVRHKKNELLQLLQTRRIPVALISETYLKVRDKFTMRNYKVYRNDREHRRGGGTAIAVHKTIQHTVVENPALHRLEATVICLNIGNKPTTLVSV